MFSPKQHDMSIVGFTLRDNVLLYEPLRECQVNELSSSTIGKWITLMYLFSLVISMVPSSTKFGLVSISIDASS
jgi:hypothetical protein